MNRVRSRPGRAFFTRAVVFALLTTAASPVLADVSDTTGAATLAAQLKNAHYARIGVNGRLFVLKKPAATAAGLGYLRVEDPSNERPAIETTEGGHVDPLLNPVPWRSLDHIEAGYRSGNEGTGAVIGLVAGLALGGLAAAFAESEMGGYNSGWEAMLVTAGLTTVIGAGIGGLIRTTDWTPAHPIPGKEAR